MFPDPSILGTSIVLIRQNSHMAADDIQPLPKTFTLAYCLLISALIALTNWFLLPLPRVLTSYNWPSQRIGWIMGMFLGAWTFAQLFSGKLSRRFGNRFLALLGSVFGICGGVCYLLFLFIPYAIIPARIFHGAGSAFVYSGVMYILLDSLPVGDRAKAIGYYGLPGLAMSIVGPAIAEILERYWGVASILLLVSPVFCGLYFAIWKFTDTSDPQDVSTVTSVAKLGEIVTRTYIILILLMSLGACASVWQTFLAPLVVLLGPGALSNFAIGHGLGAIVSRLGLSARVDNGNTRLAAILGLILYGGGLALIPMATFGWQFILIGLVTGVTYGLAFVAIISLAIERMPPRETSVGTAFLLASIGLGGFLAPPVWGVLVDNFGYNVTFVSAGCTLMVSALVFVIVELAQQVTLHASN